VLLHLRKDLHVHGEFANALANPIDETRLDALLGGRSTVFVFDPEDDRSTCSIGETDAGLGKFVEIRTRTSHLPQRLALEVLRLTAQHIDFGLHPRMPRKKCEARRQRHANLQERRVSHKICGRAIEPVPLPKRRCDTMLRAAKGALLLDDEMRSTRISWKETRARLRQDRQRLRAALEQGGAGQPAFLAAYPSYLCVWLHRVSHWLARRGHGVLGRAFWHLNLLLTGADIHPDSDLGGGLHIPHPAGVSLYGDAGVNLTVMALAGIGGELRRGEDVGAGRGLPVLGDDVHLGAHAGVLGPVRIGSRVRLSPGCIVTRDVPDDAVVEQRPPRFLNQGAGA
jgi:serine O-acetyltransferase